jgi:lipopolysaccharide transport system permease protein
LGFLWAIINPLASILILSFVFGYLLKVPTNGIPHVLITAIGVLAWTFFSSVVSDASTVFIKNQAMIGKVYFPKICLPLSNILIGLVDFLIALILVSCLFLFYQKMPSKSIIILPLAILYLVYVSTSFAILTSALSVRYRDFIHAVPLLIRIGTYLSPIAYLTNVVPEKYEYLYYLNPLVGVIDLFRYIFLDISFNTNSLLFSSTITSAIFIISLYYFKKVNTIIADII